MKTDNQRRRLLTLGLGIGSLLIPGAAAAAFTPTPRQAAGPFYPTRLPLDHDNDLTRVDGEDGVAEGEITDLHGRLLDRSGRPLANQRIEIWQCDAHGRYRHPYDQGGAEPDPRFQGFGVTRTDGDGRYRFRTIRPVPYPGRAPHIHMAVKADQRLRFTTQLYVAGDPRNDGDFLYRRIPAEQRALVTSEFRPSPEQYVRHVAEFDLILGEPSTGRWETSV